MYFQYPKAHAGVIRDPFDGVADVLSMTHPGGAVKGYRVREVLPRWLGFPNEHFIASLARLTDAQFAAVLSGAEVVDEEGGTGNCDLMEDWADTIEVDNGLDAPFSPARTSPCFWLSEANKQVPPIVANHVYSVTIGTDDKLIVRCHEVASGALVGLWIGGVLDGIDEPPQTVELYWHADAYAGLLSDEIEITYP
jgi:hypothetical protein